jgi:YVTN family beta-propeller protein
VERTGRHRRAINERRTGPPFTKTLGALTKAVTCLSATNSMNKGDVVPPRAARPRLQLVNLVGVLLVHLLMGLYGLGLIGFIFYHGEIPLGGLAFVLSVTGLLWVVAIVLMVRWRQRRQLRLWFLLLPLSVIYLGLLIGVCPKCKWQERHVGEGPYTAVYQWIPVGGSPQGIAVGEGAVWVTDVVNSQVLRITRPGYGFHVETTIPVGNGPVGVAVGEGAVWVANAKDNTVSRIDSKTNKVVATIPVGTRPLLVAVGQDAVWVTNQQGGTLSRLDFRTNRLIATIPVGKGPSGVAVGEGSVWVSNYDDNTIARIDTSTNSVVATVRVGQGPGVVKVAGGAVWVSNQIDGTVSRVAPLTGQVTAMISLGRRPLGVGIAEGAIWVASDKDDTVSRIDFHTGQVATTISLRKWPFQVDPVDIALGADGAIWIANSKGAVGRITPERTRRGE